MRNEMMYNASVPSLVSSTFDCSRLSSDLQSTVANHAHLFIQWSRVVVGLRFKTMLMRGS